MADEIKKLGRYELGTVLGKGAMGVVYQALDPRLARKVAIKTIIKSRLEEETARAYSARFLREAEALAQLNHPNIIQVYDFGEEGDVAYIVMEFLQAGDLKDRMEETKKFAVSDVIRIMSELLDALDFAHQKGVIHRDIKPANVMFDAHGRVKLADFGVARIENPDGTHAEKTQAGMQIGTPAYMSPEQVRAEKIDGRSDIFSAGVVLYQLLTGERPFDGENVWSIQKKIVSDEPNPPSVLRREISTDYDAVIRTALAKDKEGRFPTGREFKEALLRVFAANPPPQEDATVLNVPTTAPAKFEITPTNPLNKTREAVTTQSQELELEFWRAIKDSDDPEDYESYIDQFPRGTYASLAQRKASRLRRGSTDSDASGSQPSLPRGLTNLPSDAGRNVKEVESAKQLQTAQIVRNIDIGGVGDSEHRARIAEENARDRAAADAFAEQEKERRQAAEIARREAEDRAQREVLRLKREAEERAAREKEQRERIEAEKAEQEAKRRARIEDEERSRKLAQEQARRESAERAQKEADDRARFEAKERERKESEQRALRQHQEHLAALESNRREQEARATKQAEAAAKLKARLEEEERIRREAETRRKATVQEQTAVARLAPRDALPMPAAASTFDFSNFPPVGSDDTVITSQPAQKNGRPIGLIVATGVFSLLLIVGVVTYFVSGSFSPSAVPAVATAPDSAVPKSPSRAQQQEPPSQAVPQAVERAVETRDFQAEDNAQRQAAERAKAEIARLESEKKLTAAAAAKAKAETERKLAEQQARADAERAAVAAKAREEAERVAAAARAKEEADRSAAAARAKEEAERTAAAARAREDADRAAAAAKAKEAERIAAAAAAAAKAKEAERIAALKAEEDKKSQAARGETLFRQANALLKEGKNDEAMKMLAQAGAAGHAGAKKQLDAMVQEIVKRAELVDQARQRR